MGPEKQSMWVKFPGLHVSDSIFTVMFIIFCSCVAWVFLYIFLFSYFCFFIYLFSYMMRYGDSAWRSRCTHTDWLSLGLNKRRIVLPLPLGATDLSVLRGAHTGCVVNLASYSVGTDSSLSRKSSLGLKPRLVMSGALPELPSLP
jgi:hypothetical protein